MKTCLNKILLFLLPIVLPVMFSCEALPVNYSSNQSWSIPLQQRRVRPTIEIVEVQVDRSGGWDSLQKESAVLAPLYFWDWGCRVIVAEDLPVYAADIQVREREYNKSWRTKRSLAVEVRIWEYENVLKNGTPQGLPIAAGRVISTGNKSFSSSETLGRMLSKTIGKAVRQLSSHERLRKKAAKRKNKEALIDLNADLNVGAIVDASEAIIEDEYENDIYIEIENTGEYFENIDIDEFEDLGDDDA